MTWFLIRKVVPGEKDRIGAAISYLKPSEDYVLLGAETLELQEAAIAESDPCLLIEGNCATRLLDWVSARSREPKHPVLAVPRRFNQLILFGPQLHPSAFSRALGEFAPGFLLTQLFNRVTVLYSPRDRTLAGPAVLGRDGPADALFDNVACIDVTRYFDHHHDVTNTVACSLEALGIVKRALDGVGTAMLDLHARAG
jgi:hypothetical protein